MKSWTFDYPLFSALQYDRGELYESAHCRTKQQEKDQASVRSEVNRRSQEIFRRFDYNMTHWNRISEIGTVIEIVARSKNVMESAFVERRQKESKQERKGATRTGSRM